MKMRLPVLLLLLTLPLAAPAKDWTVAATRSTLGFTGSYQGEPFKGVFKRFDARITYDPAHPDACKFDVSVELASVDTHSSERDESLTGADFFAVARFPKAHFATRSCSTGADGRTTAHGTLTLRGISKPVMLRVTFKPTASGATLDVDTTLNRKDFQLGMGSGWDEIAIPVAVHGHLTLN